MKYRTQTYARADVKHRNLLSWPNVKNKNSMLSMTYLQITLKIMPITYYDTAKYLNYKS